MTTQQAVNIAEVATKIVGSGVIGASVIGWLDFLFGGIACIILILTYQTNRFYRRKQGDRDTRRLEMEEEKHAKIMSQN